MMPFVTASLNDAARPPVVPPSVKPNGTAEGAVRIYVDHAKPMRKGLSNLLGTLTVYSSFALAFLLAGYIGVNRLGEPLAAGTETGLWYLSGMLAFIGAASWVMFRLKDWLRPISRLLSGKEHVAGTLRRQLVEDIDGRRHSALFVGEVSLGRVDGHAIEDERDAKVKAVLLAEKMGCTRFVVTIRDDGYQAGHRATRIVDIWADPPAGGWVTEPDGV